MKDINFTGLKFLVVQNEFENSVYNVISQRPLIRNNKKYIVVENFRNGIKKYVQICEKCGTSRVLLKADFLVGGFEYADNWIIARFYDNETIRVEYKDF